MDITCLLCSLHSVNIILQHRPDCWPSLVPLQSIFTVGSIHEVLRERGRQAKRRVSPKTQMEQGVFSLEGEIPVRE